ncbi:hypothetical protein BDQ17DRAFT_917055 [Cyathus striatus]|nr:hypothetical protein BDQ17DRAFT_917055 [Cyathus striatus]
MYSFYFLSLTFLSYPCSLVFGLFARFCSILYSCLLLPSCSACSTCRFWYCRSLASFLIPPPCITSSGATLSSLSALNCGYVLLAFLIVSLTYCSCSGYE